MSKNGNGSKALTPIEGSQLVESSNFDPQEFIEGGYKTRTRVTLKEGQWFSRDGEAQYTGFRTIDWTNEESGEVKQLKVLDFSYKGVDVEILADAGLWTEFKALPVGCKVKIYRGGQIELSKGRRMNHYQVAHLATPASERYIADSRNAKLAAEASRAVA